MPTDWKKFTFDILSRLDVAAEAAQLGVEFTSEHVNEQGWRECRAIDRNDSHPSAAVNVGSNNGLRGRYTDLGSGDRSISFFDLAARRGKFGNWTEARDHYAKQVGLERPNRSHELVWGNEALSKLYALLWSTSKRGVTIDAIESAGGKAASWCQLSVIAFRAYRPPDWNTPVATVLYRKDGADFPTRDQKRQPKCRLLRGSKEGLIVVGSQQQFDSAT